MKADSEEVESKELAESAAHIIWVGNVVNLIWALGAILMAMVMKEIIIKDVFFVISAAVAIFNLFIAAISPRSAMRQLALGIAYVLYAGRCVQTAVSALFNPTMQEFLPPYVWFVSLLFALLFGYGVFRVFSGKPAKAYFSQKNCK
ncbi:MAG: hypothetical protein AAF585_23990 [Verrucomicrobiota bacterium]